MGFWSGPGRKILSPYLKLFEELSQKWQAPACTWWPLVLPALWNKAWVLLEREGIVWWYRLCLSYWYLLSDQSHNPPVLVIILGKVGGRILLLPSLLTGFVLLFSVQSLVPAQMQAGCVTSVQLSPSAAVLRKDSGKLFHPHHEAGWFQIR